MNTDDRHTNSNTPTPDNQPFDEEEVSGVDDLLDTLGKPQNTDTGNARRLVGLHQGLMRYCSDFGKWLVWKDGYWKVDYEGIIQKYVLRTISSMVIEASAMGSDRDKTALWKWALKSQSYFNIKSMVAIAKELEGIPIRQEALDTDPYLLTCTNGTLDLESGKFQEHDANNLITKTTAVAYDPAATCPRWEQFLREILPDDSMQEFMQRAVGYSLSGDVSARAFFILHGSGKNGKSTFLNTIQHLMKDYATSTPTSTLKVKGRNSGDSIPNDLACLRGSRLVTAYESGKSMSLDEGKIKQLSGGDPISARFLRAEFFTYTPVFKLWLSTNNRPIIRGTDAAIWDRVHLCPFNVRVGDNDLVEDPRLREALYEELPGILNWGVEGFKWFQKDGLGIAFQVLEAVDKYREDMDTLAVFIETNYTIDVLGRVQTSVVYEDYRTWCKDNGEYHMSTSWLKGELESRGFRYEHSRDARYFLGITKSYSGGSKDES